MMILDAHTHIFPPEIAENRARFFDTEPDFKLLYEDPKARLVGAETLVEALDRWGGAGACAFGFPFMDTDAAALCNDYALASAKEHPGRVIPFACVNPMAGDAALKEAERCLAAGAKGIGEIATYGAGLGPAVRWPLTKLAKLCAEADVPLLLHSNEPVGHVYPGKSPMEVSDLYALIAECPDTKWILAHWGGGLFFYHLLKKETDEVLRNVWYDTAAGPYLYKPQVYKALVEIAGADRLCYGSDFPLLELDRYERDMEAAGLDEADRKAILGTNLAKLLGMSEGV